MASTQSRASIWTAAALFFLSLLMVGGGVLYILSRQPAAPISIIHGSVHPAMITVYITGEVERPGVYQVTANARIVDLMNAANGPLADADLQQVDLAQSLTDGEEVIVPRIGQTLTTASGNTGTTTQTTLLNINKATAAEMHTQLRMSLKMANSIVAYRTKHGPFHNIADLLHVPISTRTLKRITPLITLGG